MSRPKIGIVIGSTRAARFGDKPAQWIAEIAKARGDLDIEIVDLRDYPLPFFEEDMSPAWGPSKNEVAQASRRRSPRSTASSSPPPNTTTRRPAR